MILPPSTLGILGGGQLGRYFVMAAHELGYRVWVLDPDKNSPAGRIADHHLQADYDNPAALSKLAKNCAAVTIEFENVPAQSLEHLSRSIPVYPAAASVAICQDRIREKNFLRQHDLPHAPFIAVEQESDLKNAPETMFPAILKVARFGYDGKGQITVENRKEAVAAFARLEKRACVLEKRLPLDKEISVVLARGRRGNILCFPASENIHYRGILDTSIAPVSQYDPSKESKRLIKHAELLAIKTAEDLDYVGVLGVEFFIVQGEPVVNEIAPRPHNSGHYTIDACTANQFEQQVRALAGLPFGNTRLRGAAIMVNLLGDLWFDLDNQPCEPDWERLLAIGNVKLHLYGKHEARPGRKMGHFTVQSATMDEAVHTAIKARQVIGITRHHGEKD